MNASSLNLLQFCKYSPSHESCVYLRCFRSKLIGQSFRGRSQNLDSFEFSRSIRVFGRCHSGKSRFAPWNSPLGFQISRFVEGVPVPSIFHYHSVVTIQYINSSLETVEGQIADGTLAAIACLAAFEVKLLLLRHSNSPFRVADSMECHQSCHQIVCSYRSNGNVEKDPCYP